jgi:PH (Pleckstrin Homology) domain-containing protein
MFVTESVTMTFVTESVTMTFVTESVTMTFVTESVTMTFVTDYATVTFRLPPTALLGVLGLIVCMTPVAFGAPGLQLLYSVPLGLAVWLVRTRTVVDPEALVAYRVQGSQRITWPDLAGLRIDDRSRVWAVLHGGNEVALPAVRARDLPALATISGGWLPDQLTEATE